MLESPKIRTLFKTDLKSILSIEKAVHIVPWTEDTFKTCFQSGYIGWVMELKDQIIGFIIVALRVDECHVLNLVISLDYQRKGFGQKLLDYALRHAKDKGVGIVYLEVRRSNTGAISLYRKMKFHLVGERKDYYPTLSGSEDALIFAKSLHEDFYQ